MSASSRLEALRMAVRALEGHKLEPPKASVLPLLDTGLNAPLPHGGLTLGALHEICAEGMEAELAASMAAFAACLASQILRRKSGYVLWAARRSDCYGPGLFLYGLAPERIIWVDCRNDAEVLGVMEEALRSRALTSILGEASALSLKAGQRLDAAARRSGTPAFLLRRHIRKLSYVKAGASGAAATRWRVSAAPSKPYHGLPSRQSGRRDSESGLGPPRWRLDLDYCRNGRTASWIVEASHGAEETGGKAGHVRVVTELRDDTGAPETPAARQTARAACSH